MYWMRKTLEIRGLRVQESVLGQLKHPAYILSAWHTVDVHTIIISRGIYTIMNNFRMTLVLRSMYTIGFIL